MQAETGIGAREGIPVAIKRHSSGRKPSRYICCMPSAEHDRSCHSDEVEAYSFFCTGHVTVAQEPDPPPLIDALRKDKVPMKRLPGDEATLLREVIKSATNMLERYDLCLQYSVDVADNSYTADVLPAGLDHVGVLMRLRRHDELQEILKDIVSAADPVAREFAIQRAGCALDPRAPQIVK